MAENEVKINDIPVATSASFTDNDLFLIVDDGEARLLRRSTFQAWMLQNVQGEKGDTGATGLTGQNGANGKDGINGTNGLSAYQIAVSNGFIGTEQQWIVSLKGATGLTGASGVNGWTPSIGTEVRGADELVLRIIDWTGGSGTKPAVGYLSSTGLVTNISNATNIRGTQGLQGVQGEQGLQGVAGEDAAQATNIEFQEDHSVIVTYNNLTTLQSNVPPRLLGWASYKDDQYTDLSPFNISANTTVILPNNAGVYNSGVIISNGMPINVVTFYDNTTQKCLMTDDNGLYAVRVKFKVAASNSADRIQIIFSNDTTENPYIEDRTLRGDNLIQDMNFNTIVYGDTPLSSNGMTISLKTYSRAVSIYNIEFTISKIN